MDEHRFPFPFNLQLFAEDEGTGEKTEQATPRRREEARRKGQVFKSTDLNSAVIMMAGVLVLYITLPYMVSALKAFTEIYLIESSLQDFTPGFIYAMLAEVLLLLARLLLPVFAATFIAALLITYLQVGVVFSSDPLMPKLDRLNPIQGARKIFSKRALVELVKSLAKVITTGYIVYSTIRGQFYLFPRFIDTEPVASMQTMGHMVFEIALKVGVAFLIIGIVDYIYQKYEYEQSLKMSKYDIRQEYKQTEGDPLLKSRQKQIQREMAMRRMMAEVPRADVVITNPTHFAVVLKYELEKMVAPVVVAKGQDFVAQKIKEIASAHGVVIFESPQLARTLYYSTEIGDVVPEELYQAVAEVLAFVYRQKKVVV